MSNEKLGRYEIVKEIGRGGMATIYQARDATLQRDVAIKVLPTQFSHDPSFAARFQREAQAIAALEHPAILPIYDFGDDGNRPYLVMRLLFGGTLAEKLRQGPLPLPEVLAIIRRIATAIDHAHTKGILHRDIKPSNIGFDEYNAPFLMDFGLAKITEQSQKITAEGVLTGTPAFMSPEMASGSWAIGPASDLYSFGIVVYEMLTGQVPFSAQTPMATVMKHVTEPPPLPTTLRPDLPTAVNEVMLKILAKTPTERYSTATDFAEALKAALTGKRYEVAIEGNLSPIGTLIEDNSSPIGTLVEVRRSILVRLWEWMTRWFQQQFSSPLKPKSPTKQVAKRPFPPPQPVPTNPTVFIPTTPPSLIQKGSPSLILNPWVQNLLDPVEKSTIRELLRQQEPERIVNYIINYQSGRFLITGYGSFGGTALTREIGEMVRQELELMPSPTPDHLLIVRLNHVEGQHEFDLFVQQGEYKEVKIGRFCKPGSSSPILPIAQGLTALQQFLENPKDTSPLRKNLHQACPTPPTKLLLVVDKVATAESLQLFIEHPLFAHPRLTFLVVVEREKYNQWDAQIKKQLKATYKFQEWSVPSLWETDYNTVQAMMDSMFSHFRMDDPQAQQMLAAFKKHIAFVGRGQVGTTLYELRQLRYWQIDKDTRQAFIAFETLDDDLIRQNAWMQELLEANWERILGSSFAGQERTDRAKQGIYSLMDWVIDSATFTLEEVIEEAAKRPIIIIPHKRLRDDVVLRLLDVLVGSNYLKRSQNAFDVVWGRDMVDHPKPTGYNSQSTKKLYEILTTYFDDEELRTLCFQLNLDYDDLPAEGKSNKARELIMYLERHGRLSEIFEVGKHLRPTLTWE